jgi:hypothetical protein
MISKDTELIQAHLRTVRSEPLSLKQQGALDSIDADLLDAQPLSENRMKVHLDILRNAPLSDRQKQALDLASEVLCKISLAAKHRPQPRHTARKVTR